MIIKRKIPDKPRQTLKEKIRRVLFPATPDEWHDSMAVIWRAGIISALITAVLATI